MRYGPFEIDDRTLRKGQRHVVLDADAGSARYWESANALAAVLDTEPEHTLVVYDRELNEVLRLPPPEGGQFDRVAAHIDKDTTVICWLETAINGWHDWHYAIDLDAKRLVRECPSK